MRPSLGSAGKPLETMWDQIPVGELHRTTNYGCAGGVCEGRYHNIVHGQVKAKLRQIEAKLVELTQDDPGMYYEGDFDDLLECYLVLTERLRQPFA